MTSLFYVKLTGACPIRLETRLIATDLSRSTYKPRLVGNPLP
jgi:hypothetical protein